MDANRHPQSQYNVKDQRQSAPYMAGQSDKPGAGAQYGAFNAGHQSAQVAAGRPADSSSTRPVRVGETGAQNNHEKDHPDAKGKLMAAKDRAVGTMKEQWGKLTSNTKTEEEGRMLREHSNLSPTHHTDAGHHHEQPAGYTTGANRNATGAGTHVAGASTGHHAGHHEKPAGYTTGASHGGVAGSTGGTAAGATGTAAAHAANTAAGRNTGIGGYPSNTTTGAGYTGANTGTGTGLGTGTHKTDLHEPSLQNTGTGINTSTNTGLHNTTAGTGHHTTDTDHHTTDTDHHTTGTGHHTTGTTGTGPHTRYT